MIRTDKFKIYTYLIILFIFNMLQSAFFELSYDESYYWMFSQNMSWGYYDHPPMVALFIKMGTVLWGDNELGVRFFFNLASIVSLAYLWKMTSNKKSLSFIIVTLSLPLLQAAGFLALPDTPLLLFATLFLFYVKKYLDEDKLRYVVALSFITPLMFYSKYHGLAVVLFTTMANPMFLKRKSFWFIVLFTVIFYLPHIFWQYENQFLSFRFHLFGRGQEYFEFENIVNYILSQITLFGIFLLPYMLMNIKLINLKNDWERTLFFNIFAFLTLLLFFSFRNQIEANWTVTATMAFVALFIKLIHKKRTSIRLIISLSALSILIILTLRIALLLPSSFYERKEIDRLNEVKGWQARINKIKDYTQDYPLISDTYQIAAKLSFYMKKDVYALHLTSRNSHYNLLKEKFKHIKNDQYIYYLTPKKKEDALKVDTGYKDPIYIYKIKFGKLLATHKLTRKKAFKEFHFDDRP